MGQFGYQKLLYVKVVFCTPEWWYGARLTGCFERGADACICLNTLRASLTPKCIRQLGIG